MCCTEGIDTTTISPLDVVVHTNSNQMVTAPFGQLGAFETPTTATSTGQANSAPNLDAITTPSSPVVSISSATAFPPIPPTTPPATVAMTIPDVASMQSTLRETGALLSSLQVENTASSSPLAHLQPQHLVQTPEGPKPAYIPPTPPPAGQTIQLASTAPALHAPNPLQSLYLNQQAEPTETETDHHLLSGILIVLTAASLGVLGIFMYNQYTIAQSTVDQAETSVMNAFLQSLPFVEKRSLDESPLPVWYQ